MKGKEINKYNNNHWIDLLNSVCDFMEIIEYERELHSLGPIQPRFNFQWTDNMSIEKMKNMFSKKC